MASAVLFFLVIAAALMIRWSRDRAKLGAATARLGALLGGGHDLRGGVWGAACGEAWGSALGAPTRVRFATRGHGTNDDAVRWTEIDVELPRYPLALYLRRHGWLDALQVARGAMVDLTLGDAAFDAAFLVEAAPADVARKLLDAKARAALASYDCVELTTEQAAAGPVLRLAIRGWLEDGDAALAAAQLAVTMVRRVRQAYAEVEDEAPLAAVGAPFRPALDDGPARRAAADREAEVARLAGLRAARTVRFHRLFAAMLIASCALSALILGLTSRR
jgi:hypothetical protein